MPDTACDPRQVENALVAKKVVVKGRREIVILNMAALRAVANDYLM
jgi:hypothetical protein